MSLNTPLRSVALVAALLCTQFAWPQVPAAFSRPSDLTVSIVTETGPRQGSSELALGPVSYFGNSAEAQRNRSVQSFIVSRHIRVRVSRTDGAQGKVVVRPYLLRDCDRCTVRLDGVVLSSAPAGAGRVVPLNTMVDHVIDIEIKRAAPAGQLGAEVTWQVEEL